MAQDDAVELRRLLVRGFPSWLARQERESLLSHFGAIQVSSMPKTGRMVGTDCPLLLATDRKDGLSACSVSPLGTRQPFLWDSLLPVAKSIHTHWLKAHENIIIMSSVLSFAEKLCFCYLLQSR